MPLLIPSCICGDRKSVKTRTRRFMKRAWHQRPFRFDPALDDMIDLADIGGRIVLNGPDRLLETYGDEIYPVLMADMIYDWQPPENDREQWFQDIKLLIESAQGEFWLNLVMLGGNGGFPRGTSGDTDINFHRNFLRGLLRWWPTFCDLDDRFCNAIGLPQPGYRWGRATWTSLRVLGKDTALIQRLQRLEPPEAADLISAIVA